MRIDELIEEVNYIPHLVEVSKSLLKLYRDILPSVLHHRNAEEHIIRVTSDWFRHNVPYGGSVQRPGLKHILRGLAKMPQYENLPGLAQLAQTQTAIDLTKRYRNFSVLHNQKSKAVTADYPKHTDVIDEYSKSLPSVIQEIANVTRPEDLHGVGITPEQLGQFGAMLGKYINHWEQLKNNMSKEKG